MTEQRLAKPEVWARVESYGKKDEKDMLNCLLELRSRVEALEAAESLRHQEVELLKAALRQARQEVQAQESAPAGSLVDSVLAEIENGVVCDRESAHIARLVILEIAAWVDRLGYHSCAAELKKEVPQSC